MIQRSRWWAQLPKTLTRHFPKASLAARKKQAQLLNGAARDGARDQIGLGEASVARCSRAIQNIATIRFSVLLTKRRVPFTAHVTIGGDIAHFHPSSMAPHLGATTHTDFRCLAELVRRMDGGGVYLNVGSAVVLPEVFLKCVTLVRNLGHPLSDITTANFDFIQSYRPLTNVVRRPTENGAGRGLLDHRPSRTHYSPARRPAKSRKPSLTNFLFSSVLLLVL